MFENPNVNLSALCNSRAKIACCSFELIFTLFHAGSSIQHATAIRLVYPPTFRKRRSSLKSTNKNLTEWGAEILVANEWTYRDRPTDHEKFNLCVINLSLKY